MTTKPRAVPAESRFELTGGALCLDLVNTVDHRPTGSPRDLLDSFEDLVAWAEQSRAIGRTQAASLRAGAARAPSRAKSVLNKARRLREALFDIFSAGTRGEEPSAGSLTVLNEALPPSLSRLRIAADGQAFVWRWDADGGKLESVLHPVVESAADLMTSCDVGRVRRCESERCDWLFLDKSRNRSRRWCDMNVCGNRAKARRHYHRTRKEARGA